MSFLISALSEEQFQPLFRLPDSELESVQAVRI